MILRPKFEMSVHDFIAQRRDARDTPVLITYKLYDQAKAVRARVQELRATQKKARA